MDFGLKRSFRLERESKVVLGLDIGSSSVKIVRLQKEEEGFAVKACAIAEIPSNGSNGDNQRKKLANIVRTIRECIDLSGVKTRLAVCGVSGPEVAVRDFEFPSIPDEEVEGAVQLEASQVCPFKTEDSTVDYQVVSNGGSNVRGIMVAATNALIKSKVYLAREASLHCVLLDVDGLAALNCFRETETPEPGQATAILNVGGSYTNLAIMSDDGWPFVRDLICVGEDIVKKIAAEKSLPVKTVRQILTGNADMDQSEYAESLQRATGKLVADISETLRYYNTQKKSEPLDKMFVCGDFSLAAGFVETLNKQLPVETVLWNPFDKMRSETRNNHRGVLQRNLLQKSGPAMAVAAGLAMRSI
ncbi:MAG: type IV pilus assembly protein PilM [Sedimentisphaerales bacterium]|nr:type IV pilus assembly protein PilM [Sedimentisphaerales bacterium]